ncbi:MAG TPA: cytochrome P450 [Candidatus Dormibacteraeota bacterium]|nr:cytochrome P450 [Candidatus Dormibacteraeota bacterium]
MTGWDPWDPAFRLDPYPTYDRLRADDPVHFSERTGAWLLTRHADADAALHDRRFSSRLTRWERLGLLERPNHDLQLADPPEHGRLRATVAPAFAAAAVAHQRGHVQAVVDELLGAAAEREQVDWMAAVARPLPLRMVAGLLALPAGDGPMIQAWADRIGAAIEQWEPRQEARWPAAAELTEYVFEAVEERRARRGDDLVSMVLAAEDAGRLSEMEAVTMCVTLLVTATQTPRDLLGNGARALLEAPDQLRRLAADPSLIGPAVEELLRFDAPMQGVDRVTTEPVELGGRRIEPRQLVRIALGAANRDPERFPDPGRLDLGRRPNPHLSLAAGPHHCLGAALGRLLAQTLFGTLAARHPDARLAGRAVQRPWLTFRGLESLPVALRG